MSKNPINGKSLFAAVEVIDFADSLMKLGQSKGMQELHDCKNSCQSCNSKFNPKHMKPMLSFLLDAITFKGDDENLSLSLNLMAIDLVHKLISTNKMKSDFVSAVDEKGMIAVLVKFILRNDKNPVKNGSGLKESEYQHTMWYLLSLQTLEVLTRNFRENPGDHEKLLKFALSITPVCKTVAI